ncbi:MAG: membrane protein insertion efficiency factor YidD [Sandaracinaceae bacterium]|nr:membrane protein insertion efficiency factor YidD [Sandaracinaceae bacterium]
MSPLARILLWLITFYQRRGGGERFLVSCNFEPSCSRYTHEAIARFGAIDGMRLGHARIHRCNRPDLLDPIGDPVPSSEEYLEEVMLKDERLQDAIREAAAELPPEKRRAYYDALARTIKDPDTYAVLSYALMLGVRHFYLGRIGRGLMDVFAVLFGIVLLVGGSPLGLLPLMVVFTLDLFALMSSQKIVRRHNLERSKALLKKIGGVRIGDRL